MTRIGNLWPSVMQWPNLELAAYRALRGKRRRPDARLFLKDMTGHLGRLYSDLEAGRVGPGTYRQFAIRDPKPRTISAPSFRDRVLHHAIMNVLEPHLERFAIHHSYACRVGKGQFAALDAAVRFSRRFDWYLQMDIRAFFPSIPRDRLLCAVARRFKDSRLLDALGQILHGFQAGQERGLPLGSLVSQHLANFYLGILDQEATLKMTLPAYVRYMDDWVIWDSDPARLIEAAKELRKFCASELGLEVKPEHQNRTRAGISFLGHRVFPEGTRLGRVGRVRFARRVRILDQAWADGSVSELDAQRRASSLLGFTQHSAFRQWRRRVFRER
jgi:RNA-directed DNA polymerase